MNKKQNSLMRFSRTERLAQLSEQEIVIERKKREIQAKLEAQKKKQTEEALRKLESSRETKKPGFSKKSWSGTERHKTTNDEKPVEKVKENLTNAFSNDGSFLDQFKKLSQTGLPTNIVDLQTAAKTVDGGSKKTQAAHDEDIGREGSEKDGTISDRDNKHVNVRQSSLIPNPIDSSILLKLPPPGVVHLFPQHQSGSVTPLTVDNPASLVPSCSVQVPQVQGAMHNPIQAFSSKHLQLNSSQSSLPGNEQPLPSVLFPQMCSNLNLSKQDDSHSSKFDHNQFTATTVASIQPPLPMTPQNIPPPSPILIQNIPPPPVPPCELPKLRSESISMTLKSNTVKKLEAIPNPLEVDQPSSPPKGNQLSFIGTKESGRENFFNTTSLVENVSSHDRESSRISSAFYDNDEEGEEGSDLLDEKYYHWAELVARYGDSFEDSLRNRNQTDADIRFLLDKNSKEYLSFRKLVSMHRRRLRSSEEEPLDKMQKLNSLPHKASVEEIISSSNEAKYSRITSSDEENFYDKECSSSERMASVGQQENQAHSKYSEFCEDYLPHNTVTELTLKEDTLLPSQKQLFPKEMFSENFKNKEQFQMEERPKRKRKSRWGEAVPTTSTPGVATNISLQPAGKPLVPPGTKSTLLSQLTRSDPGLIQYARQTFGSTNLSEEDWKKAEDHYKINLLYQDMVKKRAEIEKLERQGKFKYEYDSDEDTEGGTWEHKLRQQEMQATQLWAEELTRQAAGKHHIGDFLPPEELERFMEKYNAVKEGREPDLSDYKEYKLKEDNVGYRLLQKMGWNEGQGLGQDGSGITNPVNKATTRHENQGLGIERPDGLEAGDDEYDAYRKRMMLAYRFRPNPLNNPRRPYY